jgi:hypothetical protein
LIVYCVVLFVLTTKWIVQAPFALVTAQIGLYMTNSVDSLTGSEIFGAIILNTLLPLLIFCISYSLNRT